MDAKAMNLTFGDLMIAEIALIHYIKDLDLSLQSGQCISELIGKIEYQMAQIKLAAGGKNLQPLAPPPAEPINPTNQ